MNGLVNRDFSESASTEDVARPAESPALIVLDSNRSVAMFRASLLRFAPRQSDLTIEVSADYAGHDADALQVRLNELYSDCGCGAGMVAAAIALVGLVAWWALGDGSTEWPAGLLAFGVLIASAIVGKAIGLVGNRVTMVRLATLLESREGDVREGRG